MVRQINAQIAAQQLVFRYRVARMAYLKRHDGGIIGGFDVDLGSSPIVTADRDAPEFYLAVFHGEPMNSMSTRDLDQIKQWVLHGESEFPTCLLLITAC
jgi:hypothetical protein